MKELLVKYANYNVWANQRLCDILKNLTDEQWNKETISSFKSIRLTLIHIWDAQIIWYERLNGNSVSSWPNTNFNGTASELITGFSTQSKAFADYTNSLIEETFSRRCEYNDMRGNPHSTLISDIIQHCMNHSSFHRGQIVSMLRALGIDEIQSTDYIMYTWENGI